MGGGGEYEPKDSRNVTGTASTRDGRWTNRGGRLIDEAGQPREDEDLEDEEEEEQEEEEEEESEGGRITFTPDPVLEWEIENGWYEEGEDADYDEDEEDEDEEQ